jgi:thiosulfate/3-mercaptopyruvate sulfurtransferase
VIGSVIVPSRQSVGGPAAPRYHALAHPEEPDAMMTLTLAAVYLSPLGPAAGPDYPNPTLLVEPEELAKLDTTTVRILDVRGKAKYDDGHVPGSVLAMTGPWSNAVKEGKADSAFWTKELAAVGVLPTRPVVVVADDIRDAARARWLLIYAGQIDVRLLNGGWGAYVAAKLPVSKEATTAKANDWDRIVNRHVLATKEHMLGLPNAAPKARIIDTRSAEEYAAGHIPGAVRLEWTELLDPNTKKFKPAEELAKLLMERNIDPAEESCSYCQSGGRAAVVAFALELMGSKKARNYYRSWAEWGTAKDTPIEKK